MSGESEESSGGNSAGFFFYQTKDGFNFRSIDSLVEQEPFEKDYRYAPSVINFDDPNKDFLILEYNINQNIDLMNLAGFCRNCLSRWYREESIKLNLDISDKKAREKIYGMPYDEWKQKYQKEASQDQKDKFKKNHNH